jgi:hypothetical protein
LRAGLSVLAAFLYSSSNLFASSTYKYVFFIHTSSTYTYVFFIHTFGRWHPRGAPWVSSLTM